MAEKCVLEWERVSLSPCPSLSAHLSLVFSFSEEVCMTATILESFMLFLFGFFFYSENSMDFESLQS